jgi:uncharacterized protein with FMN-binding domain
MRRAPIVLSATVVGTVAVLTFKPKDRAVSLPATTLTSASHASSGRSSAGSHTRTTAPAPAAAKVVTGSAVTSQYGTTQVRVMVSGGKITAVQAIRINEDDPRSYQISSQAVPILGQEVLQKQTAAVDAVSGATFTTDAYESSLQAALDKARYKAPDGSRASTEMPSGPGGGPPGPLPGGFS